MSEGPITLFPLRFRGANGLHVAQVCFPPRLSSFKQKTYQLQRGDRIADILKSSIF